jgi:hypothetical protein
MARIFRGEETRFPRRGSGRRPAPAKGRLRQGFIASILESGGPAGLEINFPGEGIFQQTGEP